MAEPLRLLIYLVIGGLIIYAVYWIVGMLDLPPQVKKIITVVIAILVLIWLIVTFFPGLL
jgi:hypothetical protein